MEYKAFFVSLGFRPHIAICNWLKFMVPLTAEETVNVQSTTNLQNFTGVDDKHNFDEQKKIVCAAHYRNQKSSSE